MSHPHSLRNPLQGHVTYAQKLQCRTAWRSNTPHWHQLQECTVSNAENLLKLDSIHFHAAMQKDFHRIFPLNPKQLTPKLDTQLVQGKWQHHAAMRHFGNGTPSLRHLFKFWFHHTGFKKHDRTQKHQHKHMKKQRLWDAITEADAAARKHDAFSLFQVIILFTPKNARRKVRLRNAAGHPAGPVESAALLTQFVRDTWVEMISPPRRSLVQVWSPSRNKTCVEPSAIFHP